MGSTPKQLYARAAGIVVTLTLHTLGQIMIYLSADHLGHLAPHLPLREVVQDLYSTDHLTQETRTRKYGIYGNVNHSRPYRAYPSERSTVDHQERTGDILWDILTADLELRPKLIPPASRVPSVFYTGPEEETADCPPGFPPSGCALFPRAST